MHKRSVLLISPQDLMKQKDLTYLELPPDEQKVSKRPDTNKISDKDRIATSKAPQLDRKELKKILDSARPGRPGPSAPPAQQPAPQAAAAPAPQAPQDQRLRSLHAAELVARLQTPPEGRPTPNFSTGAVSQDRRLNRQPRRPIESRRIHWWRRWRLWPGSRQAGNEAIGPMDVLSDTMAWISVRTWRGCSTM